VSDLLPERQLGSGLGIYQAVFGAAILFAGIWAGAAWGGTGRVPLLVSGCIAAVLCVALFVYDPAV